MRQSKLLATATFCRTVEQKTIIIYFIYISSSPPWFPSLIMDQWVARYAKVFTVKKMLEKLSYTYIPDDAYQKKNHIYDFQQL